LAWLVIDHVKDSSWMDEIVVQGLSLSVEVVGLRLQA
jgi:hypothetical protein